MTVLYFSCFSLSCPAGVFEKGQSELEERQHDEKEILKDVETTVDQETQLPLYPENFHIKNEDDSGAGEAAILNLYLKHV